MRIENSPGEQLQALAQIGNMAAQSREAAIKAEQTRLTALSERFRQNQVTGNRQGMENAQAEMEGRSSVAQVMANPDKINMGARPEAGIKSIAEKAKEQTDKFDPTTRMRLFSDIANQTQDLKNTDYKPRMSDSMDKINAVAGGNNVNPMVSNNTKFWTPEEMTIMRENKVEMQKLKSADERKMNANPNDRAMYESNMNSQAAADKQDRQKKEYQMAAWDKNNALKDIPMTSRNELNAARTQFQKELASGDTMKAITNYRNNTNAINRTYDIKDQSDEWMKLTLAENAKKGAKMQNYTVYLDNGGSVEVNIDKNSPNLHQEIMNKTKEAISLDPLLKDARYDPDKGYNEAAPSSEKNIISKNAELRSQNVSKILSEKLSTKAGFPLIGGWLDDRGIAEANTALAGFGLVVGKDRMLTATGKDIVSRRVAKLYNAAIMDGKSVNEAIAATKGGLIE